MSIRRSPKEGGPYFALVVAYRLSCWECSPLKVTLSFEGNALLLTPGCAFVFLGPMLAPLFVVRFGKPIYFWFWEFQICYPSLGKLDFRTPHMFHTVGRRSADVIGAILINMFSALPTHPHSTYIYMLVAPGSAAEFFLVWYSGPPCGTGPGKGPLDIFPSRGHLCSWRQSVEQGRRWWRENQKQIRHL